MANVFLTTYRGGVTPPAPNTNYLSNRGCESPGDLYRVETPWLVSQTFSVCDRLADKHALAVTFWPAEEFKKQVQVGVIESFHMGATARAGSGYQIIDAIARGVAYTHTHTSGKGLCICKELAK
jgi:hypothetical protein